MNTINIWFRKKIINQNISKLLSYNKFFRSIALHIMLTKDTIFKSNKQVSMYNQNIDNLIKKFNINSVLGE